ncbi:MAG: hypothetical protein BGO23_08645 [Solirubrobacterales bacterium 67-14]|nr:MAG: hypothetical protein BGO23_08645 [Solirubrobacterales bacterium 67-14]
MNDQPILKVDGLSVAYGPVRALRGVSIEVRRGRTVSVIGPNGAGKSTLLWTITGLLKPAAGSVELEGEVISGLKPETIARRGLAIVPEGRHNFLSLTVADNLRLAQIAGRRRGGDEALYERTLDRFPVLRDRLDSPASQLSGGEAQQLAIARALLTKPLILLLDEPSFGLAPLTVEGVFEELVRLKEEGMTVLMVEQNAGKALEVADDAYILSNGEVETASSAESLKSQEDFDAAYFGEGGAF